MLLVPLLYWPTTGLMWTSNLTAQILYGCVGEMGDNNGSGLFVGCIRYSIPLSVWVLLNHRNGKMMNNKNT